MRRSRIAQKFEELGDKYLYVPNNTIMHCSKCKTVIQKAVMIVDTAFLPPGELYYCKKCFKREFINE